MSENAAVYQIERQAPVTLETMQHWASVRLFSDHRYQEPTPWQVAAFLDFTGWTQEMIANTVGVAFDRGKGSTTIRRWRMQSENGRVIPYSAWRLLLLKAGVVDSI